MPVKTPPRSRYPSAPASRDPRHRQSFVVAVVLSRRLTGVLSIGPYPRRRKASASASKLKDYTTRVAAYTKAMVGLCQKK